MTTTKTMIDKQHEEEEYDMIDEQEDDNDE